MLNPINNGNIEVNNPISDLTFYWIALFKDNIKIEQFNKDKTENKFQLVKDKFNKLAYFNLTDRKGHFFTIDLIHGRIGYNYLPLPYLESTEKKNIRLIFFRRHKIEIGEQNLKEQSHTIEYHLGIQWNTNEGYNRQIVLIIDEEGNFIVTGD